MSTERKITFEQLKAHQGAEDLWVLINGKVYNCKDFVNEHPGGAESLLEGVSENLDSTGGFEDQGHSDIALDMLTGLYLGEFDESSRTAVAAKPAATPATTTTASLPIASNYLKYIAFLVSFFAYLTWRISVRA